MNKTQERVRSTIAIIFKTIFLNKFRVKILPVNWSKAMKDQELESTFFLS